MSSQNRQSRRVHGSLKWFAVALSVVVVGLGMLAGRPDWHAIFHAQITDADAHHHHSDQDAPDESGCAIAMFASGLFESLATGFSLTGPGSAISRNIGIPETNPITVPACLEPPGRAPPFAS